METILTVLFALLWAFAAVLHWHVRPWRKPRVPRVILLALLIGCSGGDADPALPDAALDDAGNPIPPDAPNSNGLVNVPLACQPYSREIKHVSTDGSRDVTIESYASTDLVPGDDFIVTVCAPIPALTCNSGDECMGSTQPPSSSSCVVARGAGLFLDGKLVIHCGTRTERYSAAGALLSFTQTNYTTRLERFE